MRWPASPRPYPGCGMLDKRPIHLMLPCPPPTRHRAWGDYYFGQSLSEALQECGHDVIVSMRSSGVRFRDKIADWWRARQLSVPENAVELVLLGLPPEVARSSRPRIAWLMYKHEAIADDQLQQLDHLFVASDPFAAKMRAAGHAPEVLLQCTDPKRFSPDMASEQNASELLFVGNRGPLEPRPIVRGALRSGHTVSVWGTGWDDLADQIDFRGIHVSNEVLGSHYASAKVVLNDHRKIMLQDEFISNRIYDSLACARPVVTEEMAGMPEEFGDGAVPYQNEEDIVAAIEAALSTSPSRLSEISRYTRAHHSFLERAKVISARIDQIGSRGPL